MLHLFRPKKDHIVVTNISSKAEKQCLRHFGYLEPTTVTKHESYPAESKHETVKQSRYKQESIDRFQVQLEATTVQRAEHRDFYKHLSLCSP